MNLIVLIAGLFFLQTVMAGELGEQPVVHKTMKEALIAADLLKFETLENQEFIRNMAENQENLSKEIGEAYAGTWIEYDEKNVAHQIIAVTKMSKSVAKETLINAESSIAAAT